MRREINIDTLRALLNYDPETGHLYWKERPQRFFDDTPKRSKAGHAKWWNGRFSGKRACKPDCHRGYLRVCLFGDEYPAHRVIWAIVTGKWPSCTIDHIDGVISNNRFENLREASVSQNNRNRAPHGKSQYRGVSWRSRQNCWVAAIKTDGKVTFLGCFMDEAEAARAYDKAAIVQHGEFSRTNFPKADFARRIISTLSDAVAEREAKPVDERSTAQIEFEQVVAESEGGLFGQLDRLHSELEALRKRVAELKKSEDEAYRIIGKLEAHAINDIMYDGRDVAAWCANYAARRVREGGEANG